MKFSDFLKKKPLAPSDLFGKWKQRGNPDISAPNFGELAAKKLSWMRVRVKRAIKSKELIVPKDAECIFKRGKIPEANVAETMLIRDKNGDSLYTVLAYVNHFSIAKVGNTPVIAEKKNSRKGKKNISEKEVLTPAEIQANTPLELRKGWVNYELLDKINKRVCEESVKYWNEHDGKFPKRKYHKA